MNKEEILSELQKIMNDLSEPYIDLSYNFDIINDLIYRNAKDDSRKLITLVVDFEIAIEDKFDIEFDKDKLLEAKLISDYIRLIQDKIGVSQ